MEVYNSVNEQLLSQTKQSVLLDKVEFKLNENENNLNENKSLKQQYNFLKPDLQSQNQNGLSSNSVKQVNGIKNNSTSKNDGIPSSKFTICSSNSIQLEWKQPKSIGAGYINLGNTCFMNSVLQALTHCPPLVNYLLYSNYEHLNKCKVLGFCMTCELIKHIKNSYQNSGSTIRPYNIFQRLKSLAKHFQPGRQEDSHEFLRFVIDNIWKSCIINWENSHGTKLDNQSKETTFINQIFGGYHRSQVTCLSCKAKSDTYDYFMDFILDIKAVSSLEKALEVFVQPEILRNENAYKCSHCNKKVPAEKRFTVHRSPNVATFQLKRFDYNRIFGGKITKQISYPETLNLRPYMSENKKEPIYYKLNAVLVHLGSTSNSGHYFCYVRNSSNNWYLMDDSRVTSVSLNQVLEQQAYMLFYVRVPNKDLVKNSIDNTFKNHAYVDKDISKNEKVTNGKPNSLTSKIQINSKPNLPKIISETVNIKKVNGDNKSVNKNENTSNRLAILSKIDTTLNNNLSSLKSTKNSSFMNNIIQSNSKPEEKQVKKLVPYENNTSDEDSNIQQIKRQKVEESCSKLDKDKTAIISQNKSERECSSNKSFEKTDENSKNKKEDLVDRSISIDYKQPSTSSIKLVKYFSPSKSELYSSNNLNNKVNINNQICNGNKVPSTQSSWVVGDLSSNKASSIASGSSTNSINSTTEWQVIDRDSSNLKKHLHKRTLNSSWAVATHQQLNGEKLVESEKNGNINNFKEDTNLHLFNKHKKKKHKHADEKLSDDEKRLKKKLKKLKKKDKKKYLELKLNPEALQAFYKQLKKKKKNKKKSRSSDDEEKKRKKHKKKHKRERKRSTSSYSGSDNEVFVLDNNEQIKKNFNHQIKNDFISHKNFFNNNLVSSKQSNVDKELHEMHFKLLGKNVNTWDGKKTQTDRELKEDFERDKKKSKNDNYNEDYDRGKVKKIKTKSSSLNGLNKIKQNSFQKFYEEQFMKNSVDKNKFIKSL